jgi:hypothetical protein
LCHTAVCFDVSSNSSMPAAVYFSGSFVYTNSRLYGFVFWLLGNK